MTGAATTRLFRCPECGEEQRPAKPLATTAKIVCWRCSYSVVDANPGELNPDDVVYIYAEPIREEDPR